MSSSRLVAVSVGNGLLVWHTREEWDALMRGVDREAVEGMRDSVDEFLSREEPR
jgi:hypothetical protein